MSKGQTTSYFVSHFQSTHQFLNSQKTTRISPLMLLTDFLYPSNDCN